MAVIEYKRAGFCTTRFGETMIFNKLIMYYLCTVSIKKTIEFSLFFIFFNFFLFSSLQNIHQQQPRNHHERTRSSPSSLHDNEGRISPRYETPPGTPPPPYCGGVADKVIASNAY